MKPSKMRWMWVKNTHLYGSSALAQTRCVESRWSVQLRNCNKSPLWASMTLSMRKTISPLRNNHCENFCPRLYSSGHASHYQMTCAWEKCQREIFLRFWIDSNLQNLILHEDFQIETPGLGHSKWELLMYSTETCSPSGNSRHWKKLKKISTLENLAK